jgi:hAT family C-terminal dimerisation region
MTSLDRSPESFTAHRDPFEAYIYSGPEVLVEDNLLEYWNYAFGPSRISLDLHSICLLNLPVSSAVSSAECEQVFSSAKLLITNHRSRLKSDIIEANSISRPSSEMRVPVRTARVLYTKGPG